MEFFRQGYWSGLPFPFSGDLPDTAIKPGLLHWRWILSCLSQKPALKSGDCLGSCWKKATDDYRHLGRGWGRCLWAPYLYLAQWCLHFQIKPFVGCKDCFSVLLHVYPATQTLHKCDIQKAVGPCSTGWQNSVWALPWVEGALQVPVASSEELEAPGPAGVCPEGRQTEAGRRGRDARSPSSRHRKMGTVSPLATKDGGSERSLKGRRWVQGQGTSLPSGVCRWGW